MATAKTGLASVSQGSSDVFKIDPRELHVKKDWNVRDWDLQENKDHIEQLAQSIMAVGVKQPLTVVWQDNKAWIDDGECRYRACMLAIERGAPLKRVPCIAADRHADIVERRFNRYIANTGKQFNQLETAKDFKYFLDQGWSQEDIAKKAGLSQGRVSQILATLTMPAPVKAMVAAGTVSMGLAVQVHREHGEGATAVLQEGVEAAKADGVAKVKPEHVGKLSFKKALEDAIEFSDVDDSAEDVCVIKMPMDKWDIIKNLWKL